MKMSNYPPHLIHWATFASNLKASLTAARNSKYSARRAKLLKIQNSRLTLHPPPSTLHSFWLLAPDS